MSGFTILAVDDSEDDILLLRLAFRAAGREVDLQSVSNGKQALAKLEEPESARPDLVLLDLNMPGMSGFEVLEKIRSSSLLSDLPIVIFSSSQEPREVGKAYEQGANAYLMKPLDYSELVQVADSLVKLLDEGELAWRELRELACHRPGQSS